MSRPWRTAAAALAVLALAGAAPAVAAPVTTTDPLGQIDALDSAQPGRMTVTFSAGAGGRNVPLQDGSLQATVLDRNGTPVRDLVPENASEPRNGTTGATTGSRPALVLALDTSDSMVDERRHIDRMRPMKEAARQFLEQLDDQVQVGLVTFGDPAKVQAEIGTPRAELLQKIDQLRPDGDTALFSAAAQAGRMLAHVNGSRSVVMLTDGKNDAREPVDAADAVKALTSERRSPIRFTGLLIQSPYGDARKISDGLNRAAGGDREVGTVSGTSDQKLKELLNRLFTATRVNLQLQRTGAFTVPPDLAGTEPDVRISARTATGQEVRDEQRVVFGRAPVAAAAPAEAPGPGSAVGTPVKVIGLAAIFLALATLLAVVTGAVTGPREPGLEVLRRLEVYSVAGPRPDRVVVQEQAITTRLGDNALTRSAVTLMTHLARRSRLDSALDERLEAAGLPLRTAEWMLLHVGSGVGGGLLLLVLGAGRAAPTLLGLVLGLAGPWIFLLLARTRRRSRFLAQLPDTLQLLAGSLAAGYSLPQAMDAVVRESAAPIKDEFNRALIETRLGMPPEEALDGIGRRTASEDFSWIVMAIRIQRDVGGNLAELLTTVAGTLRERERLRRQVSALSAEGRLSGVILAALPVVFTGYLMLSRPDYLSPLFGTPLGLALLGLGVALLGVGAVWMAKVVKVDV